jgi:DNA-directed RNA polymerase specialized sigma24 family protein
MKTFDVDELSPKVRKFWKLYCEGLTPKEISEHTGIGLKATQSRLYRCIPKEYINAFKPLTTKQKRVLELHQLGFKQKDIANELGVTNSAVGQMLKLIDKKNKLREKYDV